MWRVPHRCFLALVTLMVACGDPSVPPPAPAELSPAQMPAFGLISFEITGRNFYPVTSVDPDTGELRLLDDTFSVSLVPTGGDGCGEVLAREVSWVDSQLLRGEFSLPADTRCAGEYLLRVTDPRGQEGILSDSPITLTADWPHHLKILPGTCADPTESFGTLAVASEASWHVQVVSAADEVVLPNYPGSSWGPRLDQNVELVTAWVDGIPAALTNFALEGGQLEENLEGYTLTGRLSDAGCGEITLEGVDVGQLELHATSLEQGPDLLPGAADADVVDVRVVAPSASALVLMLPPRITAGDKFSLKVQAVGEDGKPVPGINGTISLLSTNDSFRIVTEPLECATNYSTAASGPTVVTLSDGAWAGEGCLQHIAQPGYGPNAGVELVYFSAYLEGGITAETGAIPFSPGEGEKATLESEDVKNNVVVGTLFSMDFRVRDRYGNAVPLAGGEVGKPEEATQTLECLAPVLLPDGTTATFQECMLTGAQDELLIQVEWTPDQGALLQGGLKLDALPGEPATMTMEPIPTTVKAGEVFALNVTLEDEFGNVATGARGRVQFDDETNTIHVEDDGLDNGVLVSEGYVTEATETNLVVGNFIASQTTRELSARSNRFEVVAGAFTRLKVETLSGMTVTAGVPFTLHWQLVDDFDNEVSNWDPTEGFALSNTTRSLTLVEMTGCDGGKCSAIVTVTTATENDTIQVRELLSGILGAESGLVVVAAEAVSLNVKELRPFYWENEQFTVEVTAYDQYMNKATSFFGKATFSDDSSSLSPTVSEPFVGGELRQRFRVSRAFEGNHIRARLEGLPGSPEVTSAPFVVLRRCGESSNSPQVKLEVNGGKGDLLCLERTTVSVVADARGTTAGSEPLKSYFWWDGISEKWLTVPLPNPAGATQNFEYGQVGIFDISVAVYDRALCGDFVSSPLYVGLSSGGFTGPVEVVSCDPDGSVVAGVGSTSATSAFRLEGTSCTGEPLTRSSTMTVNTSYGHLELDTGDADVTTPGLQVVWEPATDVCSLPVTSAPFWLSVSDETQPGEVTVAVGSASSRGSTTLRVTNDRGLPRVVSFSPTGIFQGPVQFARVAFDEPMLEESLLSNPDVQVKLDGVLLPRSEYQLSYDPAGYELTFEFVGSPEGLDVTRGVATITLPSSREGGRTLVLDASGNPLDGNFSGVRDDFDDFVFSFGAISDESAPLVDWCLPEPSTFSPDGQNGPGAQADYMTVDLEFRDPDVSLWRMELFDAQGVSVWIEHHVTEDPESGAVWEWDGKIDGGSKLGNATYWFEVSAMDVAGNWSRSSCSGWFTLASAQDLGI